MKLYTKSGDKGTTSLISGERVDKFDCRVEAYGTVDELMATMAMLADKLREAEQTAYASDLDRIISQLMTGASLLAIGSVPNPKVKPISGEFIEWVEQQIDALQELVPQIYKFTIPGGNYTVSLCHLCRTVARRAERAALVANSQYTIDQSVLILLNRLSDYLYALGRRLNVLWNVEEILWIP